MERGRVTACLPGGEIKPQDIQDGLLDVQFCASLPGSKRGTLLMSEYQKCFHTLPETNDFACDLSQSPDVTKYIIIQIPGIKNIRLFPNDIFDSYNGFFLPKRFHMVYMVIF